MTDGMPIESLTDAEVKAELAELVEGSESLEARLLLEHARKLGALKHGAPLEDFLDPGRLRGPQ